MSSPISPAEVSVTPRKVFAFLAMVVGMFMAIMDIQIVSASLAEIQAGLGASSDEISWVQTSYLIAEVIMIPLSGFLARMLSTRIIFTVSAAGFTLASILCATATNIDQMIIYRAIQGFIGGGMIPSVFAAAFTIFPASKRAVVSPMIGLVATLAPTIGPTVGGYLSDAFSWHWLFLVNIIPGIFVSIAAFSLIDFDKPNFRLFNKFDWWGLLSMAAFLGSMEFVLEEGPSNDWLADHLVMIFTVIMAFGGIVFFWRALTRDEPIVDLSAFTDINFTFGAIFSFTLGIGLYGLTYLYPLYLGAIRGYDSLMIGETVFVSGAAMFLTAPLAGFLSAKIDLRLMMFIGFVLFGISSYQLTKLTPDWDFNELLVPQILRGISLMMCMVPINNIALGTLPPDKIKGASGLFNLTRNLGGAVGLAIINTVLQNRGDFHYARLAESINPTNPQAVSMLQIMAQNLQQYGLDGTRGAIAQLTGIVQLQATLMSFVDIFYLLCILFTVLAFMVILLRKPQAVGGTPGH